MNAAALSGLGFVAVALADHHTTVIKRMCDAARGKPCVVDALYAAGFTTAEVIEEGAEIARLLAAEEKQ